MQVSKNKVGKGREGKGRDRKIGLAFSPICGRKWGRVIITKFGIPVYTSFVINCAFFGVDTLRDVDFLGRTKSGFPIYFVYGPYNYNTNVLKIGCHYKNI